MTNTLWATEELPGIDFDPEPPDDEDDGPQCRVPADPDLWGYGIHGRHITTIPTGSYL